ncbi:trypsin-like serine protease [Sphingomonas ginsenosidivorax]|nr:trypsin-like serine protease [Sphingomonas ginsenosidivorax]
MRNRLAFLATFAGAVALGAHADACAQSVRGPPVENPAADLAVPLFTPGAPPAPSERVRHFVSVPLKFGGAKIQLSNANVQIDPTEWKTVAIADNQIGEPCTLSLIGPSVVLLAAHCVDAGSPAGTKNGATIGADVKFGSGTYGMRCAISDFYTARKTNAAGAPRSSDDYALCDLSQRVSGLDAEVLDLSTFTPLTTQIRLMGYGCTDLGITDDGYYTYTPSDKALRMGQEPIEATGISIYPDQLGTYIRTTSEGAKQSVLCYGDSGGPVMIVNATGRRRVIGVNSAMGKKPGATHLTPAFYFYLSPLNTVSFRVFVAAWVAQSEVPPQLRKERRVCGFNLSPGIGGCRK